MDAVELTLLAASRLDSEKLKFWGAVNLDVRKKYTPHEDSSLDKICPSSLPGLLTVNPYTSRRFFPAAIDGFCQCNLFIFYLASSCWPPERLPRHSFSPSRSSA